MLILSSWFCTGIRTVVRISVLSYWPKILLVRLFLNGRKGSGRKRGGERERKEEGREREIENDGSTWLHLHIESDMHPLYAYNDTWCLHCVLPGQVHGGGGYDSDFSGDDDEGGGESSLRGLKRYKTIMLLSEKHWLLVEMVKNNQLSGLWLLSWL